MSLKLVSLFDGIGGFPLAARHNRIAPALLCEIDPKAAAVTAGHFPGIPTITDVRDVTGAHLANLGLVPRNTVVSAGFPCQDLSVAGRREGLGGSRSGLFWEIIRILDAFRARWVVLENVPGLLSSNGGRDMGTVLAALGELGYGFAYRVLDAQFFGVPQRRRRVFIVGCLGDPAGAGEVLLEPESGGGDFAPSWAAGQEVAGTLGGGSGCRGWADDTDRMTFIPVAMRGRDGGTEMEAGQPGDPAFTLRTSAGGSSHPMVAGYMPDTARTLCANHDSADPSMTTYVAHTLTATGFDASEDGTGRGTPPVPVDLGQVTSLTNRSNPQPGDPCHPLTAKGADRAAVIGGQIGVRRLMPIECERLQGYPDGWTAGQSDAARYQQLGNSVAVPVLEWTFRNVAAYHAAHPTEPWAVAS